MPHHWRDVCHYWSLRGADTLSWHERLLQTEAQAGTGQCRSSTGPGSFQEHPRDGGLLTHVQTARSCSGLRCYPKPSVQAFCGRMPTSRGNRIGRTPGPQLSPLRVWGEAGRGWMEKWNGCSVGTDPSTTSWGGTSGPGAKRDGWNTIDCPRKTN